MPYAETLYDFRVYRSLNGQPMPPNGTPDAQVEAVIRDVLKHLAALKAAAHATTAAVSATPESLAEFLEPNWPGASVAAVDQYYWYITPLGTRVWVCIDDEVVVTEARTASGTEPVSPPITVSFEMKMG